MMDSENTKKKPEPENGSYSTQNRTGKQINIVLQAHNMEGPSKGAPRHQNNKSSESILGEKSSVEGEMTLVDIVRLGKAEADADCFVRKRNMPRKSNSAGSTNTHKRLTSILDPITFSQTANAQANNKDPRIATKPLHTKNVRHVFRDEQSRKSRQQIVKDPAFIT